MFPLIGGLVALLLIPAVFTGVLKLLALTARTLLLGLVLVAVAGASDQRLLDRTLNRVSVMVSEFDAGSFRSIPVRAYTWFQSRCEDAR